MSADKTRKTNKRRNEYIAAIVATHGGMKDTYSRKELRSVSDTHGWKWIPNWITHDKARRVARGIFSIPEARVMTTEETSEITDNQDAPAAVAVDVTPELVDA